MSRLSVLRSDIGRVRTNNEDSAFASDEDGIYVVCDGMGGASGGEVASALAVETTKGSLLLGLAAEGVTVEQIRQVAEAAVRAANEAVWARAQAEPKLTGMGTTLSALGFVGHRAVIAHVGDSRIYLLRAGRLELLTHDHNGIQEMTRSGLLTEEQARRSPFANILTKAVGVGPTLMPDVLVLDVLASDRFLLCSDGLTRYVDAGSGLAELLGQELETVADRLVELANEGGGRDNISAIVVDVEGPARPAQRQAVEAKMESLARAFGYQEIPVSTLQRVLNTSKTRSVEAGTQLELQTMTCVLGGALESSQGVLGPGEVLGRDLLIEPGAEVERVVATEPTELLQVDRGDFWRLVRRRPLWGLGLLRRLASAAMKVND